MADSDFWFKARFSWGRAFLKMDSESVKRLTAAMWALAENGSDTELEGSAGIIWEMIRDEIRRDRADRENGKKGGRPPLNPRNNPDNKQGYEDREEEKKEENKISYSKNGGKPRKHVSAQNYPQRHYTEEELDGVSGDLYSEAEAIARRAREQAAAEGKE
jgi:hypothetical protein